MRSSIFIKIVAGYFVIIFTISGVIIIFTDNLVRSLYIKQLATDLKQSIVLFSPQVQHYIINKKYDELDKLAKLLSRETKIRITVIEPDGTVLADSKNDPKFMENHKHKPEVISALQNGYGESIRYSSTLSANMLYVAMPLKAGNEINGIIRMSLFIDEIDALYKKLKKKIVISSIVFSLILFFPVFLLTRRFTKSLSYLAEAAHRVALGDYDINVVLKRKDELKDLGESFNFMASQIKNSFEGLKRQKSELDAIVNSMSDGLLVIDKDGKIILSNKSFKKISGIKNPVEKYVSEALRSPEFNDAVNKFLNDRNLSTAEIKYRDNFYALSFASVNNEYTVVVIHDISEAKRLEKIKRDFVSNISHELRTPLTAIKGFVETIEEKTNESDRSYLKIIRRNTERLINIVNDLLSLSELEDREIKLQIERVNLKELIDRLSELFAKQLNEKSLYFKSDVAKDAETIFGDYFKLEQLFINLIDNAVKYTEQGGITISLKRENKNIKIEIEDTGIGIPKEHLQRIFERFYVVDKSRSRKTGGTGLGLSIVKHIVLLHNGSINVESTHGKGTRFIIILPEKPE